MTTTDDDRALVHHSCERSWNQGDVAFADEVVAEDPVHDQVPADWPSGRAAFVRLVQTWRAAGPDLHEAVELVMAEGERVMSRSRLTGTRPGPFHGLGPTGREADVQGVDVPTVRDGRVVEHAHHEDALGLFRQLWAFPQDLSTVAGTTDDVAEAQGSGA